MKKLKYSSLMIIAGLGIFLMIACNSNSNQESSTSGTSISSSVENAEDETKPQPKEVEIAGTYSGTDNVGMKSTIILREGGGLIIHASVGDGTPNYGNWTGTAPNLSLYHQDAYGNEELIGNAEVTEDGLKILGGKFYSRQ